MKSISNSAVKLFEEEYSNLFAIVQKRICLECESHVNINLKDCCTYLVDYSSEFGSLLKIVYKYELIYALNEEIKWYSNLFYFKNWKINGLSLILDSWIVAIQGWLKSPECNELTAPLKKIRDNLALQAEEIKDIEVALDSELIQFVEYLIKGDFHNASYLINQLIENSMPPEEIISALIIPASVEIGLKWQKNEIEIFEEHLATNTIKKLLNYISFLKKPFIKQEKHILISCVPGDEHDLSTSALSTFLEFKGLKVRNLGSSLPAEQILKAVQKLEPEYLILTLSMISMVEGALKVIDLVQAEKPYLKILIIGRGAKLTKTLLKSKKVIVIENYNELNELTKEKS